MKFISTSLAGPAPLALVVAFDVYVVSSMVLALASALTRRDREGGRWLALEGIAGAIGGPGQTTVALIVLFGAWAFVTEVLKNCFSNSIVQGNSWGMAFGPRPRFINLVAALIIVTLCPWWVVDCSFCSNSELGAIISGAIRAGSMIPVCPPWRRTFDRCPFPNTDWT